MNHWNSTFKVRPKLSKLRQVKSSSPKSKVPKKPKEKTLKSKLDVLYSLYTRQAAADKNGYVACYCGVSLHWKESDCSHYIPRGCLALRYDPRNTRPSCRRCNRFMGGNLQAYALALQKDYGLGILEELEREKRKIVKNFPYQQKITEYEALLITLER